MSRPKIALSMIVRDEEHVITECLESVAPYIDTWVICDTGSEDDTPEIIKAWFKKRGIPGALHHHEWKDFGHNRTRALQAARGKADYAWVIDADDYLVGKPKFGHLGAGSYDLFYRLSDSCSYWRRQLFRLDLGWEYRGVVHEYPHSDTTHRAERIHGDYHIQARRLGGVRNRDENKYRRDVELLERAHADDPTDTRTVFYLAQSHYDHGDMAEAEHWYRKRAGMGGWDEEVFYSLLRVGLALEQREVDFARVQNALLTAWDTRPGRAEPLCHLARLCRHREMWPRAHLFAKTGLEIPFPKDDLLFIDEGVWAWRLKDERAIAAYWLGRYEEARRLNQELLGEGRLPDDQVDRVRANLKFAEDRC